MIAWSRRWLARVRVAGGLTLAQLRHHRLRLGLAIVGVALAVLAITLLAGTGVGVLDTGEQQFDAADRDLWVTGGETRLTTAGGGGFENSLYDSRERAVDFESHDDVRHAIPLAFETVYVGDGDGEYRTFIGAGVRGGGPAFQVTDGEGFSGDPHYANGSYDGEMTHEVLVDRETADRMDVEIGDQLHIGGTLSAARANEFTIVGITPTFETMIGAPTVVMPLSELHQVTGTTGTEPATFITVTVEDGADVDDVQRDLEEAHPDVSVRSNQEQLEAVLQEQVVVVAAAGTLIFLAVGAGIALTVTLLGLVVYQQRREFAALNAQGVSTALLVVAVGGQGLVIGLLGGGVGVLATVGLVGPLNQLTAAVVGFEGLIQPSQSIYLGALAIAVGIGTVSAILAGWRVSRTPPLEQL